MVEFTFAGFQTGTSVALSVSQNGMSDSGAVAGWNFVAFSVEEVAGEAVITHGESGGVSISISGGSFAGTYTTDSDGTALTTGYIESQPVNLVKPQISGATNIGALLTCAPGLWIYANDDPGDPVFQWLKDGSVIPSARKVLSIFLRAAPIRGLVCSNPLCVREP